MIIPASPNWATSTNYSVGLYPGNANKATPPAANVAEGFNPGTPVPAEYVNAMFNNHASWLNYLNDDTLWRETWLSPLITSAGLTGSLGTAATGWPWWAFSSVNANNVFKITQADGTVSFPRCSVKPGTANTNNGWAATAPGGTAGSGALFYTTDSLMRATLQWVSAVDVLGANNVTLNMGLDDASNTTTCFANNAAVGSYFQFRKKSTDTNWQCVTGTSGGAETTTDIVTGGGTMPGGGAFATFRITFDGTAGSQKVTYFVGGLNTGTLGATMVQVAQHTTNIPATTAMRVAFGGTCTGVAAATMYMGGIKGNITNAQ